MMRGFIRDSLIELFDRKIIYLYAVMTLVLIGTIMIAGKLEFGMNAEGPVGSMQFTSLLKEMLIGVVTFFMSAMVFVTVMTTAGTMPNSLERGRAEYYLSQPFSRSSFLFYRMFSAWVVFGGLITISALLSLLTVWLVHDFATFSFLHIIWLNLISLLIWLIITFSVGALTGSTTTSIITAFIIYIVHWALQAREFAAQFINSRAVEITLDVIYYVLPKPREISDITSDFAGGKYVSDWLPVWSSLLFVAVLFFVTAHFFRKKDF